MPTSSPDPTNQPPRSARLLRYLLWASELGLVLAVLYVLATQQAAPKPAPSAPPPASAAP